MSTNSGHRPTILVTGATGKQGGAVIDALLEAGAGESHIILAVTRNSQSTSAKNLESRGVRVVEGDLNDVPAIFTAAKTALKGLDEPIWGVFSVQTAIGKGASAALEEAQGKALVDAALDNNVEHFVYSSVDRGGDSSYDNLVPEIEHFASKYRIEHHLVEKAQGKMGWTILRPVAFMENMTPGMGIKVAATSWRLAVGNKRLQHVSVRDIGWFAAQAFLRPRDFLGRQISLAGDELTLGEANQIFKAKMGMEMPETFQFFVRFLHWLVPDFGSMYRWFFTHGFRADIAALRKEHVGMRSFSDWLNEDSAWADKRIR
ncbi:NmrA-like family domain-containing protein 1-like protein 4 [Colletotrichum chlorophyti]|uniref:NmrA-like family domain-containing protein 1-like protein 4 n=1 Tax=Colletotrichum chlorophyti TaxID=708187 RepID=A0A1Q8RTV9_9PEZI|nr:NmrA-like family domain-containing protein 1-like protein 4 [Colletotrichum chlorophyti]